jgi:hypothetical protein
MLRLQTVRPDCGWNAWRWVALAALAVSAGALAQAQAITISNKTSGPIDRRYLQIEPTKVALPETQIDARGHQEILRTLVAEQGFAMRPFPKGKKGLNLTANGKLNPAGESYMMLVTEQGLSVKPGDRVVLSNIKIDRDRIIFDINGGPDHKHDFLRHIQIGVGGPGQMSNVAQDDSQEPTGSRLTLTFSKFVPDLTPVQLKALLAPLISFDVKSPAQAYTDTLPPKLKDAILNHHVMVGMNTDMVLIAMGPPEAKSREMEGQMPFEEWIYGHPPQDVNFIRVNGNRVIRVEVAKLGQPLQVFTRDEVEGMMMTDGRPVLADAKPKDERTIQLGDVHRDPDTQAPVAPPSLRKPGEKLPEDSPDTNPGMGREGPMKPVVFPKDTTKDPARTVPAHPKPTAPPDEDNAPAAADKPADKTVKTDAPATDTDDETPAAKPDAAPAPDKPASPKPNYYTDHPQPAQR